MPVLDHPVNEKCKIGDQHKAGCWNKPRVRKPYRVAIKLYDEAGNYVGSGSQEIPSVMSILCRQLGEYRDGEWHFMDECEGCSEWKKDWAYIRKMRGLHEEEMRKNRLHGVLCAK